ncbi:hypothetical protein VaNZ11_008521, partial [Volvox africanus]
MVPSLPLTSLPNPDTAPPLHPRNPTVSPLRSHPFPVAAPPLPRLATAGAAGANHHDGSSSPPSLRPHQPLTAPTASPPDYSLAMSASIFLSFGFSMSTRLPAPA